MRQQQVRRSLVCVDEHKLLRDIERLLKKEIPRIETPGYEVDPSIKAEPIQNGRQGGGRGQGGGGRGQQPRRAEGGAPKSSGKPPRRNNDGKPAGESPWRSGEGKPAGEGSADAARASLLTRSNLEARS